MLAPSCCSRRSVCFTPIGLTSTGIGMIMPEPLDPFVGRDHRDPVSRGRCDDLLAQQGTSAPLIIWNCGSISSAPSRLMSRVATSSSSRIGIFRLRASSAVATLVATRDDLQSLLFDPLAEPADHQGGRRARPEADDHSALNQGRRRQGGAELRGFGGRCHSEVPCPNWLGFATRRRSAHKRRKSSVDRGAVAVSALLTTSPLSCSILAAQRPKIGATRFELVTSCSQGRRANQAALRPAFHWPVAC